MPHDPPAVLAEPAPARPLRFALPPPARLGSLAFPVLVAALFTGLNALKPLTIDDAALEWNAREMAAHPLDPFGFAMFWWETPEEANAVLTPPLLPYYWALARSAFGEAPWAWKLALFPWALLFVFVARGLCRRFARPLWRPLLVLIVFSPAFLPSLNLMLDVPALALGLAAFAAFRAAVERDSFGRAAVAGLLAGLAMQTKYTGFVAPGVMLVYAAVAGRLRLWPAAAVTAAHVFLAWELLTACLYGRSHFLLALSASVGGPLDKFGLLPFLFSYLGGLLPAFYCLGLAGLGLGRRWLLVAAVVFLAGYVAVAAVDAHFTSRTTLSPLLFGPQPKPEAVEFEVAEPIFHLFNAGGLAVLAVGAVGLLGRETGQPRRPTLRGRETTFLLLWLGMEVLGYLALTPFPATRRVLGVALVLALLFGRIAATRAGALRRSGVLAAVVGGGVALGLAFFALDWHDAWLQQAAAERAAVRIAALGGGRTYFVGHWGFQFYAGRQGMRQLITAYRREPCSVDLPPPTELEAGDWVVVPDGWLHQQGLRTEGEPLELVETVRAGVGLPLRTVPAFYSGRTAVEHNEERGLSVRLYRVTEPFTPVSGPPAQEP